LQMFPRIVLFIVFLSCLNASDGQQFALHDGDRVVFYGDSITAQRLYTRFVEDFVLTRYPQMHVDFSNAGIPGDTVYGGYTGDMETRVKRDLVPHQPTVVTIMLGMNDGYYMAFDPKYLKVFEDGYHQLLGAIQAAAPAAKITLLSPTPYDEVTHGTEFANYNATVGHYAAAVKGMALSSHLDFSDFDLAETNLLNAAVPKEPSLAALLVPDRIHPAEASHWVMAATLARSWGMSPIVSSVTIDAAKVIPAHFENTLISDLGMKEGKLTWTQIDTALPLPLALENAMIPFVLSISDLADMDKQMLRVDGLLAFRYKLAIDGHRIASFTQQELSSGVNLALYPTPMEEQAKGVDGIELKRTRLDETRFLLDIEDPKVDPDGEGTKNLAAKDAALALEQRKQAQPKPHRFQLSPE